MDFKEPYIQINTVLLFIISLIFAYSFLYPALMEWGWVVPSSCEGLPEVYCRSRGLTRAFAQIMHFKFDAAASLNTYALTIFIFFVIQFFARILFSWLYSRMKTRRLIQVDAVLTGIYFVYTFFPLTFMYYWIWERKN